MRLKHYSIRTERSYADWVRRYVRFHRMRSREELLAAEPKIEAFLSHLAVEGKVAVSTQNQAFNALLFLYREVLHTQLGSIDSVRATRPGRVPTVLTPEEAPARKRSVSELVRKHVTQPDLELHQHRFEFVGVK